MDGFDEAMVCEKGDRGHGMGGVSWGCRVKPTLVRILARVCNGHMGGGLEPKLSRGIFSGSLSSQSAIGRIFDPLSVFLVVYRRCKPIAVCLKEP
jgi:hypothetical protein